jgi:SnoaL-like domain
LPEDSTIAGKLAWRGDAPGPVRNEVLLALRGFQDGYSERQVAQLDPFVDRLFSKANDDLIIGTDPGEWISGYTKIKAFIRTDWQSWGDVRLDVDAAVISASGDVAWLATVGNVLFQGSARAIRFSAILCRDDGRWVFRQVQFSWQNHSPALRDFVHLSAWRHLRWR